MSNPKKIAVLISGNGSNLQAIIDYQKSITDSFEIVAVLSNKPDAYGLTRAEQAGITSLVVDHTAFDSRLGFDKMMIGLLDSLSPDYIVLAGFMRILTPEFTQHYEGRMINIHPSLLPKYQGLNTHQRAIDAGDSEHGLSIHVVTSELDSGAVIMQAKTAIATDETSESLQQKIHALEHLAYPLVIDWLCRGKLEISAAGVHFQGEPLNQPLILNDLISLE